MGRTPEIPNFKHFSGTWGPCEIPARLPGFHRVSGIRSGRVIRPVSVDRCVVTISCNFSVPPRLRWLFRDFVVARLVRSWLTSGYKSWQGLIQQWNCGKFLEKFSKRGGDSFYVVAGERMDAHWAGRRHRRLWRSRSAPPSLWGGPSPTNECEDADATDTDTSESGSEGTLHLDGSVYGQSEQMDKAAVVARDVLVDKLSGDLWQPKHLKSDLNTHDEPCQLKDFQRSLRRQSTLNSESTAITEAAVLAREVLEEQETAVEREEKEQEFQAVAHLLRQSTETSPQNAQDTHCSAP